MDKSLFQTYYENRGFDEQTTQAAIRTIELLEQMLNKQDKCLDTISTEEVRQYVKNLVSHNEGNVDTLLAMARYFYLINRQDIYIYFTSLLGGRGVIETIVAKAVMLLGQQRVDEILQELEMPRVGLEPSELTEFTSAFVNRLERELPLETVKEILAGNNHGIPKDSYLKERELLHSAKSLDDYLLDYKNRGVQELQAHCDQNKVWYEQKITQEVVDYANSNQEIMSAVREGNILYVTKIPYDPVHYLEEKDPKMKRYYACHCPFAREAILQENVFISPNWCYCSGGFAKFPYEVLFDQPLKVELLQSVLKGDMVCRFAVHLPHL